MRNRVKHYGTAEEDEACCVAVSPDGATVLVTGYSFNQVTYLDYITVAYRG